MMECNDLTIAVISDRPLLSAALGRRARSELQPLRLNLYRRASDFRGSMAPSPGLLLFDPPPEADLGLELCSLHQAAGASRALVLIPRPDPGVARLARACGFRGVLPKASDLDVIAAALRLVLAGGECFPGFDIAEPEAGNGAPIGLSRRQAEVLAELKAGASNKEIARKLGIVEATVKIHVRALMAIADARNRTQIVVRLSGQ
jgi:DNA-binding NarL/FixJ family response regulator